MDQLTALLTKAHEAQRLINEVREAWNERCAAAPSTPSEIDAFETVTQFMFDGMNEFLLTVVIVY